MGNAYVYVRWKIIAVRTVTPQVTASAKRKKMAIERLKEKVANIRNEKKDTNPKDAVGVKKAPISTLSGPVVAEMGLAMLEGARKYGRHNYRISGVRASVYRDATFRHMNKWWEGEDIDPDSGVHHLVKALASLAVLRDAQIFNKCIDDRPPALPNAIEYWKKLDTLAAAIIKKYPDAVLPFTNENTRSNDEKVS